MVPAIRVDNLSKRYRVGRKRPERNVTEFLRDGLRNAWGKVRQLADPDAGGADTDDFWALKDVSFEVQPGEVVGIIGRNGAGKSTLLKILSQIVEPTAGHAEIDGRVGSLLEVGTGFHPELTGRENVYLNGTILGMGRKEIDRKFDAIVDFSGIESFLDTPVKRYSSGMGVRLGFAIAAHLEPEVLIVDEVLAVGDQDFQQKCLGKMREVSDQGRTVIVVSHNMPVVLRLCGQAVLLDGGKVRQVGVTADVVSTYLADATGQTLAYGVTVPLESAARWGGSGEARLTAARMFDPVDPQAAGLFHGGDIGFRLTVTGRTDRVRGVGLTIRDDSERKLINVNTLESTDRLDIPPGGAVEIELRGVNLKPGRYPVDFWLGAGETQHIDVVTDAAVLEVLPRPGARWMSRYDGLFRCPFTFRVPTGVPS